jgi:hypothetical protein
MHSGKLTDMNLLSKESLQGSEITLKDGASSDTDVSSYVNSVSIASTIDSLDYVDTRGLKINDKITQRLPMLAQSITFNRITNANKKTKSHKNSLSFKSLMPKLKSLNQLYLIKDENEDDDTTSQYNNDWSKQSCSVFLTPIEAFLQNQRQRENSSKQRCGEILKKRSEEYDKKDVERRLKEYDDKICLNVLLRKNRELNNNSNGSSNSNSSHHFRKLLVSQNLSSHSCDRCHQRKRNEEKAFLNDCMEYTQVSKELQKPKLPRILPKLKLLKDNDDYVEAPFKKRKSVYKPNTSSLSNDSKSVNSSLNESFKHNDAFKFSPRKTSIKH